VPLPGPAPEGIGHLSVCFAPDGKTIAYAWRDKAYVLDVASGDLLATLGGVQAGDIRSIALSPDAKTIALGVSGVLVGEIATGKKMRRLIPPKAAYGSAITFSPDGATVAWGAGDFVILSDPVSGKELGRLEAPMGLVDDVAFTPDGKSLVSGSNDGRVRIWDVANGKVRLTLDGRIRWGFTIALSPDGKTVALGTGDQTVRLWDVATGRELFTEFEGHESSVGGLTFSFDGKTLFSSSNNDEIRLWSTGSWKQTQRLPGHNDSPNSGSPALSFSPNGKQLAFVSNLKTIRTWDMTRGQDKLAITVPDANLVYSATFSDDGRTLLSMDRMAHEKPLDRAGPFRLRHWDATTGQQKSLWIIPQTTDLPYGEAMLVTAGDKKVLIGGKGAIRLYDVESGRERLFHGRQSEWLATLALSADGRLLASGQWGGSFGVSFWEVATGKEIFFLKGHERSVAVLAWSADGRLVASGDLIYYSGGKSGSQTVRLWDAVAGKELACFGGFKALRP
jgi:WD40 repeat protein